MWLSVELTDEDMIEFVLDQSITDIHVVGERVTAGEVAIESHFLRQPPMGRFDGTFSRSRMAAARVRPEAARVIFVGCAALQQQSAGAVEHED